MIKIKKKERFLQQNQVSSLKNYFLYLTLPDNSLKCHCC